MDGMYAVLLLAVATVAFGTGILTYKWIQAHRSSEVLRKARKQAAAILAEAKENADAFRAQVLEEARDELDDERNELREARANLDQEREANSRAQRKSKNKWERLRRRHNNRTRKLNEREKLLHAAAQAIETLQQEAERANREVELLRVSADSLLQDATTQRADLSSKRETLREREGEISAEKEHLSKLIEDQTAKLEQVAGLSSEEAIAQLRDEFIEDARLNAAAKIRHVRDEASRTAKRQAQRVILTAIQRLAVTPVFDNVVSVVHLESDNMKGRIIGREGRNIRAFEASTGVELIIDDTPSAVIISSFDPYRREIARLALTQLLQDGRIHAHSIEKYVAAATVTIEEEIIEIGERIAIDFRLHELHNELIRTIGRMRYRTSYGQNLLAHSIEVARIASLMAAEIGLDTTQARRAGLLHDIGKVIPESADRPHALVGMDWCKRYGEHKIVCNAVGAHHDEIEMTSLISPIVQAADAISGARPGARREQYEEYIQRLNELEKLALSFDGVKQVYAIQGGREVRVMVSQNEVSDQRARDLAEEISQRIQSELRYPGQIKVMVIREIRQVAVAR